MHKGRLEAFSDGVFAIIITIMVLELKVPQGHDFEALKPKIPIFFSYLVSFIYVATYWANHHHLLQATKSINAKVLWANHHVLFWTSLIPFVTAWTSESHFSPLPVALYGVVLLLSGFGYNVLTRTLIGHHGRDSHLAKAIGSDFKGYLSLFVYLAAATLAIWQPMVSYALYVLVLIIWLVPDRRMEKIIPRSHQ